MKSIKAVLFCLVIAALTSVPTQLRAQETDAHAADKKPAKQAREPGAKKQGVTPFHGNLKAVDKTAKTVTVGSTTVQITSETKIQKDGKPATLDDAVVGEAVGGAYRKSDDGKLNATMVRFGAKPEAANGGAKKEKKPKKAE